MCAACPQRGGQAGARTGTDWRGARRRPRRPQRQSGGRASLDGRGVRRAPRRRIPGARRGPSTAQSRPRPAVLRRTRPHRRASSCARRRLHRGCRRRSRRQSRPGPHAHAVRRRGPLGHRPGSGPPKDGICGCIRQGAQPDRRRTCRTGRALAGHPSRAGPEARHVGALRRARLQLGARAHASPTRCCWPAAAASRSGRSTSTRRPRRTSSATRCALDG